MPSASDTTTAGRAAPQVIDVAVVRELLGGMKSTYGTLNSTLATLRDQGERVKDLGPTMQAADDHIDALSKEVDDQERQRADKVKAVREKIESKHKQRALDEMQKHFKLQILEEVKKQVQVQMDRHMYPTHLPKPLAEHVKDGREQVTAMKAAVHNSQARRENATITWTDMTKKLAPIQRPDGSVSAVWPNDLNSLLSYDAAKTTQLVKDYDLFDHGDVATNLNRFMAHIGVVNISLFSPVAGTPVVASRGH
ncbi:hypothetical protein BD414DRAFT_423520 [Trametes punicea]|nr:hypothetical protein BD414DRAFT_423520 [Trametes punicea]